MSFGVIKSNQNDIWRRVSYIYIEPMFYRKELEFDIYSAVVTHGHSGQLPGCPQAYEPHANLCIL
jgi:hypothetical protein